MPKETVVINFDIVISGKGELVFCEGGPGWGSVGYEGYQDISGKTMEESIIIALQKWHKTIQFTENHSVSPYQQPQFSDLEIMRLPKNLPDTNKDFYTHDRSTLVKKSKQIPPSLIVAGNPALPSQCKPYDLAELYHANGGNNPILNGHGDAYRLMVGKVMTISLLKDIAPDLAKNTTIINLKHLKASDKEIASLQGEWIILKPSDATRAFGIVVLPKKHLKETLDYLAGDDVSKNVPNYFKHVNRATDLKKLYELYKESRSITSQMLIAQKYVPPLAVEIKDKKYSATVRVVIAACLDTESKQIELQYIGAYNKLAVKPITKKGFDWDERISSSMTNQEINKQFGTDKISKKYVLESKQESPMAVAITPMQQEVIESKFIPAIRPVMEYILNNRAVDHFISVLDGDDTATSLFYRDVLHLFPTMQLTKQDCNVFVKHRLNLPLIILYAIHRKVNIIQDTNGNIMLIDNLLNLLKTYHRYHSKDMPDTEREQCNALAEKLIENLSIINMLSSKNFDLNALQYCLKLDNPSYPSTTDNVGAVLKQAANNFKQKQYSKAFSAYNTIITQIEKSTDKVSCYYNMASCQARMHHFSQAIEFCQTVVNLGSKDSNSASTVQKAKTKIDQLKLMVRATEVAKMGLTNFKSENFSSARDHFIQAVEFTKESTLAKDLLGTYYYNLASCHARLKEHDQAVEACQLSVNIREEELGETHNQTISSKDKLQKLQQAAAEAQKQQGVLGVSCQITRPF